MTTAWIGLGGNLQDAGATLARAIAALSECPGLQITASSSLYRSAPWGYAAQDDFVNAVVRVQTTLQPLELLDTLQSVEQTMGRTRQGPRFGPRNIDLDLLLYDDMSFDDGRLILPHPRMHQRRFVLEPLVEIDPDLEIPGLGLARELLGALGDQRIARIGKT